MTRYTHGMTTTMDTDTAATEVETLVLLTDAEGHPLTHEQAVKIVSDKININELEVWPEIAPEPEDDEFGVVTDGDQEFYCDVIIAHLEGEHTNCWPDFTTCDD